MSAKKSWSRWGTLGAGLLGVALMSLTASLTLGAFSATVVNPTNSFSSATIVLQQTAGSTTCDSTGGTNSITASNSYNCTTIDDLGAAVNQVPGGSAVSQALTLKNVGASGASTFTMTPGACAQQASAGAAPYSGTSVDFCNDIDVTIQDDTVTGSPKCVYPSGSSACPALSSSYTLNTLGAASAFSLGALAAGASDKYTIKTQLDSGVDNTDQGLTAKLAFTWSLTQ